MNQTKYSQNQRAGELLGFRPDNEVSINLPCEKGFHCPVCKYNLVKPNGEYDERLTWSEYNAFIWCSVCDHDYPSTLCMPDIDQAINIFLTTVEEVVARHKTFT
jgi:hypothetical protein